MRWSWVAVLLVLPMMGGCLDLFDGKDAKDPDAVEPADVGYDPESIHITGVEKVAWTIPSYDETDLAAVVYAPLTDDKLPNGTAPRFGVVLFLHGWANTKEQDYEGVGGAAGTPAQANPATDPAGGINRLQQFAQQGLIAVAYDARGFGQSGGITDIAGAAEQADIAAVIAFIDGQYATNGRVGIVGKSYGAGQAYQALADNPHVTTIVPMYGWVDLYDGLLQGGVPKIEWATFLLGTGAAAGKAQMSPLMTEWLDKAVTRTDLATVEAQMDQRSVGGRLATVDKPLLVCQGLQETLFPQADRAWGSSAGFARAIVYTGGHGYEDETCWSKTVEWMQYFLAGRDTGVAAWPALTAVDADGSGPLEYHEFPQPVSSTYYLRSDGLDTEPSNTTFTIEQQLLSNPLTEPSGIWDQAGEPYNQVPEQFRQDPTAVFFETAATTGSQVLLGTPVVTLKLADPAAATQYQVAGTLYHVDAAGKSRILSHSAGAGALDPAADNSVLELQFWWTKADLAPGDKLVLKLAANDSSLYLQMAANYSIDFTGESTMVLPFFEG